MGTARLHVARAGQGEARGPAVRPLRLRHDPVRDAVGPARVPRRHAAETMSAILRRTRRTSRRRTRASSPASSGSCGTASRRTRRSGSTRRATSRSTSRRCRESPGTAATTSGVVRGRPATPAVLAGRRRSRRSRRRSSCGLRPGSRSAGRNRPPPSFHQLTFRRGQIQSARFAPDGPTVVYSAAWDDKPMEIVVRRLESPDSRPFGLAGAEVLAISRSGEMAVSLNRQNAGGSSESARSLSSRWPAARRGRS